MKALDAEWMDAQETCAALGIQPRTLLEWAQKGHIDFKYQSREGKKPERFYKAAEVEKLRIEGPPRKQRRPPLPGPALVAPKFNPPLQIAAPPAAPSLKEKLWLTLPEAAEYTGLTAGFIAGLVAFRHIVAVKGGPHGAWRVQRESLEQYSRTPRQYEQVS
jgi:excisionase family DNA binding protein